MHSRTWVPLVAAIGAASLLVTACSGGEEKEGDDDKTVSIQSLMGAPDYENVDYDAQQVQIEEAVAECMKLEGWEYIPVQYPSSSSSVEYTDEDEVERLTREGLGVTYYMLQDGSDDAATDDPWADFVDPNQEYIESLSADEQTAFYGSLYGTEEEQAAASTTEIDPETGEEYTMMTGNLGCQGEAYDEINGDDITSSPGYWEAIQGYYDELQTRVDSDSRMVELNDNWVSCMSDAGYDYESRNDFWETSYTEIQERADEVLGEDYYKDPMEGWTEDEMNEFWESATQEEIDALYADSRKLTAEQRTQLEAILADEVALALAEHECSKDLNEKGQEIYAEIEEQYALEHEDELKALAASLAGEE